MKLFRREKYISRIRPFFQDTEIIKVISGIRRSGKSSLMQTIAEELVEQGVSEKNILFYNLDKYGYKNIKTSEALEELLFGSERCEGIKYVFIDEIQNVEGFEPVLEELRLEGEYSIFITGSNSYLLSGELATKLTGRYIEFEIQTLGFDEYEAMKTFYGKIIDTDILREFDAYLLSGGFPKALFYDELSEKQLYVKTVLEDIFNKDIKGRVKIKNVEAFNIVRNYVINNFGSTVSISNICDDLKKTGIAITRPTITRYIQALCDAKIISECTRFDMKSRRAMKNEKKYYLADLGIYYSTNTDNRINYGPVLENVVYQYARSMGYMVSIGKIGNLECDFVLRSVQNEYAYVQVALTIMDSKKTEDREYRPLESIADGYPKYLVTRRDLTQKRNGIKHVDIIDFVLNGRLFD
ncbi:MAG: ATP-binding protein [Lachnospiraceae bacterium]|nr:ATP-binding protein [Lachnospiraceae bacterium]